MNAITHHIDIQNTLDQALPFADEALIQWAILALGQQPRPAELTLRFVDEAEMQQLNAIYRQIDKPTNVLAFPSTVPDYIFLDYHLLGDVIICPAVLEKESQTLGKSLIEHWAHILMHGVLHLLGYDHIIDQDRFIMQARETELLAALGFSDPYPNNEDD